MPFGEDSVNINYNVNVSGIENVEALAAANDQAAQAQARYNAWVNSADEPQKRFNDTVNKGKDALRAQNDNFVKATRSLIQYERGIRSITLLVIVVGLALKTLTDTNDSLAATFESSGKSFQDNFLKPMADGLNNILTSTNSLLSAWLNLSPLGTIFKGLGVIQEPQQKSRFQTITLKEQIADLNRLSEVQKLMGNDELSLDAKIQGERLKFNDEMRKRTKEDQATQLALFNERATLLKEETRLAVYGLVTQQQAMRDFNKNLVSGFQTDTGNIIGNFIAGKTDTTAQMIQMFRDTLGKEVGEAISKTLFTTLFKGGNLGDFFNNLKDILTGNNPVLKEAQDTNKKLDDANKSLSSMANCGCPGTPGSMTATLTPSAPSIWQTLSTITGAVASVGGAIGGAVNLATKAGVAVGSAATSAASGYAPGYSAANPPIITSAPTLQKQHSGGFVGAFAGGGEVPALVQPGEFIVRRAAAQENKSLLQDINSGRKPVAGGGQNVFFITANDAKSFADMLSSPSARNAIANQVVSEIMANGQLRNAIKNFGS